jgi:hypothetical protein
MSRVRFAAAMSAMSCWSSVGIGGRPRRRDFQRQNSRKVSRCHRTNLSGRTIVSGVVGRCVRVSTRAGSAGTDSRPRAASETGTSGPTVVAGHRRQRTPCGSREAIVLCGPRGDGSSQTVPRYLGCRFRSDLLLAEYSSEKTTHATKRGYRRTAITSIDSTRTVLSRATADRFRTASSPMHRGYHASAQHRHQQKPRDCTHQCQRQRDAC